MTNKTVNDYLSKAPRSESYNFEILYEYHQYSTFACKSGVKMDGLAKYSHDQTICKLSKLPKDIIFFTLTQRCPGQS